LRVFSKPHQAVNAVSDRIRAVANERLPLPEQPEVLLLEPYIASPMPELSIGNVLAGYRIEGVAGRGGMGVVFRATQLALDRQVALKLIAPELAQDESFREPSGSRATRTRTR
jgi:serine/threonine protein kinase